MRSLSTQLPHAGAHLKVRGRRCDQLVALLQPEPDAKRTAARVVVRDRKAAFDLALARLVRVAVAGGLRDGAVAPLPFDGRAVVLLEIVGTAGQTGAEDDAHRDDG